MIKSGIIVFVCGTQSSWDCSRIKSKVIRHWNRRVAVTANNRKWKIEKGKGNRAKKKGRCKRGKEKGEEIRGKEKR